MAARTREKNCYECGGSGLVDKPYSPGGYEAYIRFVDEVCKRCDGTGVI
jgi:DnaJ-class molecular chaperone